MSTFKDFLSVLFNQYKEEEFVYLPEFWYVIFESCLKELKETCGALELLHLENLNSSILKLLKLWSTCFEIWNVDSFETLLSKTGTLLAGTFNKSLSSQMIENVTFSFAICVNKEKNSRGTFLDTALRATISTLYIPVPLAATSASADGGKTYHAENSSQAIEDGDSSDSSTDTTGLMQSFISFTKKGETSKRGLKETVQNLKIIVSSVAYKT